MSPEIQDAPDAGDFKSSPGEAIKESAGYSVGFGIVFTLLMIAYYFIARPLLGMINKGRTALLNAQDSVDTTDPMEGF